MLPPFSRIILLSAQIPPESTITFYLLLTFLYIRMWQLMLFYPTKTFHKYFDYRLEKTFLIR